MKNKNNIFDTPQREELIGIIVHFGFNLMKSIKNLWVLLIPLIFNKKMNIPIISIIIGGLIIMLIVNILRYLRFTYFIDTKNAEFVIESGILNRKQLRIHRDKVQDINLSQTILQRIFNVYSLKVDSQGSTKDDVQLKAISHAKATAIRNYLLVSEANPKVKNEENTENKKSYLLQITPINLLRYAVTSNYIRSFSLLLVGLYYIIDQINEFFDEEEISLYFDSKLNSILVENSLIFLTIIVFISIFILIIISNIVIHLYRYYNLQLQQKGQKLNLSYGLIETKNSIISIRKIQYLITKQNWIQKKWNILGIKFHQIGQDTKKSKNSYIIPACKTKDKEQLIISIFGEISPFQNTIHANIRKFFMKLVFFIIIPILIITIFFQERLYDWLPLIIVYCCAVSLLSYFNYKNSQLKFNDDYLNIKSGVWDISNTIIPIEKIQKIETKRFFWQKKTNLGTIFISTAGGNIYFSTANYSELQKLMSKSIKRICEKYRHWL
ncbi:PH domain-containing protein [Weeksellaceae bacterium TAE3-ERU29]|nr:PH domain-containing protein [Weeksellaceae bacterium TAE3-ERU29]